MPGKASTQPHIKFFSIKLQVPTSTSQLITQKASAPIYLLAHRYSLMTQMRPHRAFPWKLTWKQGSGRYSLPDIPLQTVPWVPLIRYIQDAPKTLKERLQAICPSPYWFTVARESTFIRLFSALWWVQSCDHLYISGQDISATPSHSKRLSVSEALPDVSSSLPQTTSNWTWPQLSITRPPMAVVLGTVKQELRDLFFLLPTNINWACGHEWDASLVPKT